MSGRGLTYMIFGVILAFAILLLLNFATFLNRAPQEQFLSRNNVRGSGVMHNKQIYTLNFAQQNALIDYINHSEAMNRKPISTDIPDLKIEKIIVYLFNGSDIEISFVGQVGKNLLLSSPTLSPSGYLIDTSDGAFAEMLSKSYDR